MTEEDEFYAIRTAYYLGDFVNVEKEYNNLKELSGNQAKERDSFLCRACIAQNKFKNVKQICGDNVSPPLLAVKQLSQYKQATSIEEKELVIETLQGLLEDETIKDNVTFCVITSQIFVEQNKYKEALQLVNQHNSLEKLLMQVIIYLKIYRQDLASKALERMKEIDDDDPLTTLANIQINLNGTMTTTAKAKESIEMLDDLCANNDSPFLRNMMTAAYMTALNFNDAYRTVKKARDLCKTHNIEIQPSTYINSIICLQHLNEGTQILDKLYAELARVAPNHPFLKKKENMEQLFDRSMENFKL